MDIQQVRESGLIIEKVEQALQAAYSSNSAFNESVDSGGPISFRSLKDPEHVYSYYPSEVLYWADRKAYLDELDEWDDRQSSDRHQETVEYLKSSGQLSTFLDIVDAVRLRRVAPFVGAGLSQACGYPSWASALEKLVVRLEGISVQDIRPFLETKDFLKAAQVLFDASPAQARNFIRTEFRSGLGAIQGPVKLLPEISQGCIVTTNFDTVIEDIHNQINQPLDGYMYGTQPGNNFVPRLLRGERCILKLHGDARQENTYVFTEGQYQEAYGDPVDFRKPLPRALRQIFISHSLLFLGCSLEQDRTLELFQSIVDEAAFEIPDHFAILPRLDAADARAEKASRLLRLKIQPLWYEPVENDHSMLERLLQLALAVARQQVTIR